jgi:hypothetical protein
MGENIHDVFGPNQVKISRCDFFRNLLSRERELKQKHVGARDVGFRSR